MSRTLPFVPAEVSAADAMKILKRKGATGVAVRVGAEYRLFGARAIASALGENRKSRLNQVAYHHLDLEDGKLLEGPLGPRPPANSTEHHSLEVSVPIWTCPKCDYWALQPGNCPEDKIPLRKS
jgi:hypothetical protein